VAVSISAGAAVVVVEVGARVVDGLVVGGAVVVVASGGSVGGGVEVVGAGVVVVTGTVAAAEVVVGARVVVVGGAAATVGSVAGVSVTASRIAPTACVAITTETAVTANQASTNTHLRCMAPLSLICGDPSITGG
jgi:hypothetical protein